jgi:hypothetical protein
MHESHALISNDATLFGILAAMLGVIFYTSQSKKPAFKKFYSVIPALLLCYFLPSLLTKFFTRARPSPMPEDFVVKLGSKTFCCMALGIPPPLS